MHKWDVSPKEAIAIQKTLREKIILRPLTKKTQFIGGADVSMNLFAIDGYAGFVVLDAKTLAMKSHSVVKRPIPFPYIPGLLSFREIPLLIEAWKNLKQKPDVVIVDGVGIAHPRRMGIATHLGLVLGVPTVGCAKNVLTGVYTEPADEFGAISHIYERNNKKEIIGVALRTKRGVKPVFISAGHLITLKESVELVKRSVIKHRLPEPTRLAHNIVNEYRLKDQDV